MLLNKKTRIAATYLGTWLVLLVVFIYGPILITALADPSTDVRVEGINYVFDTLLFAGADSSASQRDPTHGLKFRLPTCYVSSLPPNHGPGGNWMLEG